MPPTGVGERLAKIEATLEALSKEVSQMSKECGALREELCASEVPVLSLKVGCLEVSAQDHEDRLRGLEKLIPSVRAVLWVGAAFGLSVVALIWALIVGQAQIVFP